MGDLAGGFPGAVAEPLAVPAAGGCLLAGLLPAQAENDADPWADRWVND